MRQQNGVSRILIVDDDVGTIESFSLILRLGGFAVETAATGQEGLERARRRSLDLLLTDLCLPDVSGIDVVRYLRQDGIFVPTIMMTAFATTSSAVDAIRLGVVDYVEKPLCDDDLMSAVAKALARDESAWLRAANVPVLPAVDRWAELMLRAVRATYDPRTLEDWAELGCMARGTLEKQCQAARVAPKASLDLARVLRAVSQAHRTGGAPDMFLNANPRTVQRLLGAAGLTSAAHASGPVPTPLKLLDVQQILSSIVALDALRYGLAPQR